MTLYEWVRKAIFKPRAFEDPSFKALVKFYGKEKFEKMYREYLVEIKEEHKRQQERIDPRVSKE
jgi:hypothetical protein